MVSPNETRNIDVLYFSVPGVDPKNITIENDLIVVRLPQNYIGGDYIKPEIIFGTGYSSQSLLLNGLSYNGQEITLDLESTTREKRTFNVIVVPYKTIQLNIPAQNQAFTIGPEVTISTSYQLKGTRATVNDIGRIVSEPFIRFTDITTKRVEAEIYAATNYSQAADELTIELPPSISPGNYKMEFVWGAQTEIISHQIEVKPGATKFKRGSWQLLRNDKYFSVTAFNLSPTHKYEAIIQNDFVAPQRIPLMYEKPGTLSGNLPEVIGPGNYRIKYLLNGKEQKPYEERMWLDRYSGDDHFFIRKSNTQPILRIVTQLSLRSSFSTPVINDLPYFPSTKEINRKEPILAYTQAWGAFPDNYKMMLVNQGTGAEFSLPYSGSFYGIFDNFLTFPAFPIPNEVPNGKYAVYVVRGTEKTENYSQIITLK